MKRFVLAGLTALAVTFAAHHQASAGGFSVSGSIGLSGSLSINCWGCPPCCPIPCCPPACNYGCPAPACGYGYGYAAPYEGGYGYGYAAPSDGGYAYNPAAYAPAQNYGYYPAQPQQAQPAPKTTVPVNAPQGPSVTPVGYYPYSYNYSGYNYGYQTPSYWYGR